MTTKTKILVGIWTEDSAHYSAEKAALESAIHAYGIDWILAISVGSEDLYRGDTTASTLAQQIYDVRGMVRALGVQAEVGHVDTYNAWTNSANDEVIKACDFIGMDAYPYWQGSSIEDAYNVFFQAYQETKNHVQSVGSGAWVVRLLSFLSLLSFFLSFSFLFFLLSFSLIQISFTNTPCQVFSQQKNLANHDFFFSTIVGDRDVLARDGRQLWQRRTICSQCAKILAIRRLRALQRGTRLLVRLPRLQRLSLLWRLRLEWKCHLRSIRLLRL